MGKKKISEFPTVTPTGTDLFLVERNDGSYKSVLSSDVGGGGSQTLSDTLTNGNVILDGQNIMSEDEKTSFLVRDSGFVIERDVSGVYKNSLYANPNGIQIFYNDVIAGVINAVAVYKYRNEINNTLLNIFNAPSNQFPQETPTKLARFDASGNLKSCSIDESDILTTTNAASTYLPLSGGSLTGKVNEYKGANIASATTTNIGAATGNFIHITGTTTITAFDTVQAGTRITIVFDASLILTHNATTLILPGGGNIVTGSGDTAIFISEGGGNWRCISYMVASEAYTNYTPTFTGFSVAPTINAGDARWKMLSRNTCHVIIYPGNTGVSNAGAMTVTLPFNSANIGTFGQGFSSPMFNNGAAVNGSLRTRVNSNIADCYPGIIGSTFTGSGNKSAFITITYQIEA